MKTKDFLFIILFISLAFYMNLYNSNSNRDEVIQKLDSILIMQEKIYELDSMYLKSTRVHMGQCSFILKEGVSADINN